MKVKELIQHLLECPMDANVELEVLTKDISDYQEGELINITHGNEYVILSDVE